MLFKRLRSILLTLAVSLPLSALAGPFTNLFVFGDSLSDTGNLATAYASANGLPIAALPPLPVGSGFNGPYFQNSRLSNGPVWIEQLAAGLGLASAATPYLQGGNNYAFAGAETGTGQSTPGVLTQAFGLWGGADPSVNLSFADPNALYVVVGGGNDMRAARSAVGSDAASRQLAAAASITNLATTLNYLASKGAKNILISTLPNLGDTPEAALLNLQAASTDAANQFNALIQTSLVSYGAGLGLHMNLLDMDGLFADVLANPASFGISNTSLPCAGFEYSAGTSCAASLFTDILHPSGYAHSLLAQAALDVLGVPEPDALALVGLALLTLIVARRRRAA
jgi:phospholipase/lecithinase/hemolysin